MVRPVSLTVIGLYFIISASLSILSMLFVGSTISMEMVGANPAVVMIFSTASSVILLAAGVAILQQQKWGRTLLLFFVPVSVIISVLLFDAFREFLPITLGFTVVLYGIIFYFLFRRDADEYFAGTYSGPTQFQKAIRKVRRSQKNPSDLQQVFGVLFLIAAGFFLYLFVMMTGFSPEFSGLFIFTFIILLPAVICYIAGVFLWGKMRWMAVTGWIMIANGIMSIISVIMYWSMTTMDLDAFLPPGESLEPEQLQMLMQSNYMGIVIGLIGLIMLYYQIRRDHDDAAELLADMEEQGLS